MVIRTKEATISLFSQNTSRNQRVSINTTVPYTLPYWSCLFPSSPCTVPIYIGTRHARQSIYRISNLKFLFAILISRTNWIFSISTAKLIYRYLMAMNTNWSRKSAKAPAQANPLKYLTHCHHLHVSLLVFVSLTCSDMLGSLLGLESICTELLQNLSFHSRTLIKITKSTYSIKPISHRMQKTRISKDLSPLTIVSRKHQTLTWFTQWRSWLTIWIIFWNLIHWWKLKYHS